MEHSPSRSELMKDVPLHSKVRRVLLIAGFSFLVLDLQSQIVGTVGVGQGLVEVDFFRPQVDFSDLRNFGNFW